MKWRVVYRAFLISNGPITIRDCVALEDREIVAVAAARPWSRSSAFVAKGFA